MEYPECEKWADLLDNKGGKHIINFLQWLQEQDIDIMGHNSEQLLMKYGDIDPAKLEKERRAMIESIRT